MEFQLQVGFVLVQNKSRNKLRDSETENLLFRVLLFGSFHLFVGFYLYLAMNLTWNSLNFSRNTFSNSTDGKIVILQQQKNDASEELGKESFWSTQQESAVCLGVNLCAHYATGPTKWEFD